MKNLVAVTGEGPTDYGRKIFNTKLGKYQWQWGPVKELLEKCRIKLINEIEVEWVPVEKEDLKRVKLLRTDKNLKGRAIPARKFRNYCCEKQIPFGIFYTDADRGENSGKEMKQAEKHFIMVYSEVKDGLEMNKPEDEFIPMIPMKMIENWLLADEGIYNNEYGKIPTNPSLPKQPELIWGNKEDPKSDYPKNYLSRVLADVSKGKEKSSQEVFCRLIQYLNIDIIRDRCPISFERFCQDFQGMCRAIQGSAKETKDSPIRRNT